MASVERVISGNLEIRAIRPNVYHNLKEMLIAYLTIAYFTHGLFIAAKF